MVRNMFQPVPEAPEGLKTRFLAPLRQRYARPRARGPKPAPIDITGYPIRVIPPGRPSFSADITPDEPLFRLT
jgi:hypothetical protein